MNIINVITFCDLDFACGIVRLARLPPPTAEQKVALHVQHVVAGVLRTEHHSDTSGAGLRSPLHPSSLSIRTCMLWTLPLEASRLSTGYHVILHQIYAKLAYLKHHIFLLKKYLSVQYVDPGKPGIVARHQGDELKHFIPWCMK
jgi:hypothetical protein